MALIFKVVCQHNIKEGTNIRDEVDRKPHKQYSMSDK